MVLSPQRGHLTCCRAGHGAVPPPLPCSLLYMFKEENDIANNCSGRENVVCVALVHCVAGEWTGLFSNRKST